MTEQEKHLRQSASLMRILGWLLVVGLFPMVFIYPPGFMWGAAPEGFPFIGPAHAPSPYDGLHPYLYMLGALYVAYGILLIRGAKDPRRNVAVNAPDVRSAGRVEVYTQSAGSMTLYLELFDVETNDLLAKVMDPKADRQSGFMQWQTGPANLAAGKCMMRPWAKALRSGLDEARDATHRSFYNSISILYRRKQ